MNTLHNLDLSSIQKQYSFAFELTESSILSYRATAQQLIKRSKKSKICRKLSFQNSPDSPFSTKRSRNFHQSDSTSSKKKCLQPKIHQKKSRSRSLKTNEYGLKTPQSKSNFNKSQQRVFRKGRNSKENNLSRLISANSRKRLVWEQDLNQYGLRRKITNDKSNGKVKSRKNLARQKLNLREKSGGKASCGTKITRK